MNRKAEGFWKEALRSLGTWKWTLGAEHGQREAREREG